MDIKRECVDIQVAGTDHLQRCHVNDSAVAVDVHIVGLWACVGLHAIIRTHIRQRRNYLKLSAFFWFMFAKLMRDIRLKLDGTVEQLKLLYSYSTVLLLDLSLKGLIQFVHSSTAIPSQFVDDDIWCPQVCSGQGDGFF